MTKIPVSLTLGQMILGIAITLITTVGGAYVTIKMNEASNAEKISALQIEVKELKGEVKELRDTQSRDIKEILKILGEIRLEIGNKANR
jgi:uncharacterized membrane protein (DUF106 family)